MDTKIFSKKVHPGLIRLYFPFPGHQVLTQDPELDLHLESWQSWYKCDYLYWLATVSFLWCATGTWSCNSIFLTDFYLVVCPFYSVYSFPTSFSTTTSFPSSTDLLSPSTAAWHLYKQYLVRLSLSNLQFPYFTFLFCPSSYCDNKGKYVPNLQDHSIRSFRLTVRNQIGWLSFQMSITIGTSV